MPVQRCSKDGKLGWQWGDSGTCYIGNNAKKKAEQQAAAIYASGYTEKSCEELAKEIVEEYVQRISSEQ